MSSDDLIGKLQTIRGCPFPDEFFPAKNIEDVMDHVPRDDDVVIASYPKTGTTWMQYIVLQIVSGGGSFPTFDDLTYKVVPFVEMSGIAAVEAIESRPRVYKHHIAYDLVRKNPRSKCVYVYRFPEDTVVSFYHFSNNFRPNPTFDRSEFDSFVESFLSGNIGYGSYFPHVLSYYEHREDGNVLLVSYERLHANRKEEMLRIAGFLGREYRDRLAGNQEVFDRVLEHTSFEYMKRNLYLTRPKGKPEVEGSDSSEQQTVTFFRKGVVGDGKSLLTDDQRKRIKEMAQKVLAGTSILDEWYPE